MTDSERNRYNTVQFIKARMPYGCKLFVSRAEYAPDNDKSIPLTCTIVDINELFITCSLGESKTEIPFAAVKKIIPMSSDAALKDIE